MAVHGAAGVSPDRLVLRALRDRAAADRVGRRAHARLDPEPAVRGHARRAHAPEPRDSRHDAAEPRRDRAAGAGDRPAVRARRPPSSSRSSWRCGARSRSTCARRARPSRICARPCWRRRGLAGCAHRNRPPHGRAADAIRRLGRPDRRRLGGHRGGTAAHRSGSDHQRRAPCRRHPHPRRAAPGARMRSGCASPTMAGDSTWTRCCRPAAVTMD